MLVPGLGQGSVHGAHSAGDKHKLIIRQAFIGGQAANAGGLLPLEAAHALAEELVEVRSRDGQEARPLQ